MLEKPEKKIGSKLALENFYDIFNFWPFLPVQLVHGAGWPPKQPKTPTEAKKRVLVITLARGGVTGRSTPPFTCTMGVFDCFRRVRDPNGTIWTTFGPPAGPARPALPGPEKFFGRGSPGSRKFFFPKRFFCSKTIFIGS